VVAGVLTTVGSSGPPLFSGALELARVSFACAGSVDREPVVLLYEAVPPEPDAGRRLPIYALAHERIR
jgi:hypothetical protein